MIVNIVHMVSVRSRYIVTFSILSLLMMSACTQNRAKGNVKIDSLIWVEDSCQYANNFAIQRVGKHHLRVLIFEGKNRTDTLSRLYQGSFNCSESDYIHIDSIKNIATLSSTYVGFLDALKAANSIRFVDETDYVYSRRVRKEIENGNIIECGSGETLNYELMISSKPLILAYQIEGGSSAILDRLEELNMPHLNCTDFKEDSPLGRAEWLKVFGLIVNNEKDANLLFNEIAEHYIETKYFYKGVKTKPTVFTGSVFGGEWNVSGGKSFVAQFIADAGGDYAFANDTQSLNIVLPFETVFLRCKETEVWLHPSYYSTYGEIKKEDERYALFEAFVNKRVYNNNKMKNGLGGNAYWEMGVVRPDIVLKDIAQCLHPILNKGNTQIFYKSIE